MADRTVNAPSILPLRRVYRSLLLLMVMGYGVVVAIFLACIGDRGKRGFIQHWSNLVLRALQVRVCVRGDVRALQGGLILPNHVSWLDIIVLNALLPARFVAKHEVSRWIVIGWLARRAGTLFLRRHASIDVRKLKLRMGELIASGENIVLFAEGTTTIGETVLPFHSGLLEAAVQTKSPVYPAAIRYHTLTGGLDALPAFVDECSLVESMWKVTGQRHIHVVVAFGQAVEGGGACRRRIAIQARAGVENLLQDLSRTRLTA